MRIIDICLPIHPDMPAYPGDPEVRLQPWTSLEAGDAFAVTALRLGTHTGTHVDAPAHCFAGAGTIDTVPLEVLCGSAYVLDLTIAGDHDAALRKSLERAPIDCSRLLLRTRPENTKNRADGPVGTAWPGLSDEGARHLIRAGVRLVGINRLSIAAPNSELTVHRLLLAAGVVIVEGLVLEHVAEGGYDLFCLPLRLMAGDGAPARAVLLQH